MTPLDWAIATLVALFALRGLRAGLVSQGFSLAGIAVGAYLGFGLASRVPYDFDAVPAAVAPFLPTGAALLFTFLGVVAAAALGDKAAAFLRRIPVLGPSFGALDGLGGAVLGAAVGLAFAWVLGPFASQAPLANPAAREAVERSEILGALNERVPPQAVLGAVTGFDPLPGLGGPPPAEAVEADPSLLGAEGVEAAAASVVRVVAAPAVGYGSGSSGSGWVAAPETVVTAAHVVEDAGYVAIRRDGAWGRLPAEVLLLDGRNDLAVLHVEGLEGLPSLTLAEAVPGEPVAVLGYPGGGPLDVGAGRVGRTAPVLTRDAEGGELVGREVTSVRAEVRPGNSGGPVVDARGEVVGTVFGAGIGTEDSAYAAPSSVTEEVLETVDGRTGG